jgi:hypothetical protein
MACFFNPIKYLLEVYPRGAAYGALLQGLALAFITNIRLILQKLFRDKHPSLFCDGVSGKKGFVALTTGKARNVRENTK